MAGELLRIRILLRPLQIARQGNILRRRFKAEGTMGKPQVMLAVRNADSIESLMSLASQLARGMDADLAVLHVVEVPLPTPLEASDESLDYAGNAVLAQAQRMAEKFSQSISTQLVR